jgi:hypothetical protein
MNRARSVIVCLVVIVCLPATAASAFAPANGNYQGCPNDVTTTAGHCEGEGLFTLKGNKIKGYKSSGQILAPFDFSCNAGGYLKATSISVSAHSTSAAAPSASPV